MAAFRKVCRWLHRELGFFAVGLTLVYAISGIAVNHVHHWDPNRTERVEMMPVSLTDTTSVAAIAGDMTPLLAEGDAVLAAHELATGIVRVITEQKVQFDVDRTAGVVERRSFARRPLLFEMNFLHLNTGKGFWTVTADVFAGVLIVLAVTGIFLVKGRRG